MKRLLAGVLVFVLAAPALGWNDKGHLVSARLAWRRLTDDQRAKVVALLKQHPHYEEFLTARNAGPTSAARKALSLKLCC
jgi:hypothetical protein